MSELEEIGIGRLLATAPEDATSLAWLSRAHGEQLRLCDALEEIADSLPDKINRQKCIYAAKALGPLVRGVHRYEETVLFPALLAAEKGAALAETIARLKFEHCEDECFSEELSETLLSLGRGDPVNAEAAGYMLRGFFEAMRRHIAFERQFIVAPPAQSYKS